jgi:hypothetical protein
MDTDSNGSETNSLFVSISVNPWPKWISGSCDAAKKNAGRSLACGPERRSGE